MATRSKVFTYQAELNWQGGHTAAVAAGDRPPLPVAPPPDFPGGESNRWSPEHLFLGALESCTMLSFLAHCEHSELEVLEYSAAATGAIERRPDDHRYAFTHVDVVVRVRMAPGQAAAARGLTGKAERDCFVTASTTAHVTNDWRIIE
jgi:organic hydroperoxide reductase OsmC/OhrA